MPEWETFRVEVCPCETQGDAQAAWIEAIHQLGFVPVESCVATRLFYLQGALSQDQARDLAHSLLADPATEQFRVAPAVVEGSLDEGTHSIEVTLLPGVADPVAESLVNAAHLLGYPALERAATGQRYLLRGSLTPLALRHLAVDLFSNPVIQRAEVDRHIQPPFAPYREADRTVEIIPLRAADDTRLQAISAERRLALDLAEMQAIRAYYQHEHRDPTDLELEMLAQTWSEHCVHKTFKATIHFTGPDARTQRIDGLLKTYLRAATERINKPWVQSAFIDNAGVITFDDRWDLAFKVETHNHPSALEPFGGANTGIGGVIRDVLGVSARPIANTDVLCFGPQDLLDADLPAGVLHPHRVQAGVVRGIEDYGNKLGIPTVNGAIQYHPGYTANPLVFCGCLGLLPHGGHSVGAQPGDYVVALGGRTGRDGLRGATFSSMEMDQMTGDIAGSAVQIGHPINEKQVLEVVLQARDEHLYHAITDCGAGGLSSAVGEMAAEIGAAIQLDRVLLKYPGLRPWEIWLSEAQERMVLAIPPDNWTRFATICAGHEIQATHIGEFTGNGRIKLRYGGELVGDLDVRFLHDGIPTRQLDAVWQSPLAAEPHYSANPDFAADLLALLAHPNIRSKEAVIRRYDHEVQGGTAVRPLVGAADQGPSDAAVIVPLGTANGDVVRGAALSAGLCPQYGEIDPYAMAWAVIDEAVRNAVAVGADPDQVAILDNFCWGNPNLPDRLGSLVRAVQGCHDAALAYGTPFISGKDSLNNEYTGADSKKHAIPGTLLISALGIVPDVRKTVTMDLKRPGNLLYLIGETRDELGGSHYHMLHGIKGGTVPQRKHPPYPKRNHLAVMQVVHRAIQNGLVAACHDCSEGGVAVAIAEMCIAGGLGARVVFGSGLPNQLLIGLFSESLSRFIVEVPNEHSLEFIQTLSDVPWRALGLVTDEHKLEIRQLTPEASKYVEHYFNGEGELVFDIPLSELESAFRGDLPTARAASDHAAPVILDASLKNCVTELHAPRVLILHARGTNRDRDAALACGLAGGLPEIVTMHQLTHGERSLLDYSMLVVPGGFSFGDDLGAGVLWGMTLRELGDDLTHFIDSGRPVLGICNGFQTLVKAGLLPGPDFARNRHHSITLTYNARGHFECRWVYLKPNLANRSIFLQGLDDLIYCPIAHGEGRIAARDTTVLEQLQSQDLIALSYVDAAGNPADYPANPNGSVLDIAGLTNPAGNVLGLMPHPEDHIFAWQHPRWRRGEGGMLGLRLFENAIKNA